MQWPSSSTSTGDKSDTTISRFQYYREHARLAASTLGLSAACLGSYWFYRSYIRRIPGVAYIKPSRYRKGSLFGTVTRVGDGDNFHLYHTPGGRLAGWGLWRTVPDFKPGANVTIPVRIAGIDAPECAHFGKEAQPFSAEALTWLRSRLMNQRVRIHIYSQDRYNRVVGRVTFRSWLYRRDVGLDMLKAGLCTIYTANTGAEFGGLEKEYRRAEQLAKDQKKGIWSLSKKAFESPRDYKTRTADPNNAWKNTGHVEVARPIFAVASKLAQTLSLAWKRANRAMTKK